MCSSSANICSKIFPRFPQGAPTGVRGLATKEVGKKTELSKQYIGAMVSKCSVWGFRKCQSEWPLYSNIKYLVGSRGVNFDKTRTPVLKETMRIGAFCIFVLTQMAPFFGGWKGSNRFTDNMFTSQEKFVWARDSEWIIDWPVSDYPVGDIITLSGKFEIGRK